MISKIFIAIFSLAVLLSVILGSIIVYHFNKFKLSCDRMSNRILKIIILGTTILIILALVFLLLIIF